MNDLPITPQSDSLFDQYSQSMDPTALAALIMIESQDTVFGAFEDSMLIKTNRLAALSDLREALAVAMDNVQQAQQEAGSKGADPDTVITLESEDAQVINNGIEQAFDTQAGKSGTIGKGGHQREVNADAGNDQDTQPRSGKGKGKGKGHRNDPTPTVPAVHTAKTTDPTDISDEELNNSVEAFTETYIPGEDLNITLGTLNNLIEYLSLTADQLSADLALLADSAASFLRSSEDAISKITDALRSKHIDSTWLEAVSKPNGQLDTEQLYLKIKEDEQRNARDEQSPT